jgi:hypothetical protein
MPSDQAIAATSAVPAVVGGTWSLLPTFDGQTIVSIALGAALTIVTFWIGYRKTIGAQDERLRAASAELCASVIKRVAVEREVMTAEQFAAIRQAKSYKAQVQTEKLISFDNALNTALLETIDNNFLDSASKKTIIELIDSSRTDVALRGPPVGETKSRDAARERIATILALFSAGLGLIGGIVSYEISRQALHVPDSLDRRSNTSFSVILAISIAVVVLVGVAFILFYYMQNARRRMRGEAQKS